MVFDTLRGDDATCSAARVPERLRPTARRRFWEYLAEQRAARRTAPGCTAATASSCMSGNCVDGVCCAQTAAQCSGTCKSCNVAGQGRDVQQRPGRPARRHLPERPGLRRHPAVQDAARAGLRRVHRVRQRPLRRRRLLQHRLQRHLQGMQPGRQARAPARTSRRATRIRSAHLPASRRTTRAASCDGSGHLHEPAEGRTASRAPRAASARAASASTASAATASCAQTCYQCDRAGLGRDLRARSGGGQVDHSATTPCDGADAVLQRLRDLRDEQEAERRDLRRPPPTAAAATASTASAATAPAPAPASRARCRARLGACVNVPAGSQDTNSSPAVQRRRSTATRARHLPVGQQAERRHVRRRRPSAARASASTASAAISACTDACYTCNGGTTGTCSGDPDRRHRLDATTTCAAPNYCTTSDHVHDGQEAERRGLRERHRVRVELLRRRDLLRERPAPATAAAAPTRRAPARCAADGHGSARRLQGRGRDRLRRHVRRAGACRWAAGGQAVPAGGLPERPASSPGGGRATAPATAPAASTRRTAWASAATTDAATGAASARPTARPIRSARSSATARSARRRAAPTRGTTSTCPVARSTLGHACTRNTQCLLRATVQRRRLLQHRLRPVRHVRQPGRGDLHPDPAGTDPETSAWTARATRRASAAACATATRTASTRRPGRRAACARPATASASATSTPEDDDACGTIECNGLEHDVHGLPATSTTQPLRSRSAPAR